MAERREGQTGQAEALEVLPRGALETPLSCPSGGGGAVSSFFPSVHPPAEK